MFTENKLLRPRGRSASIGLSNLENVQVSARQHQRSTSVPLRPRSKIDFLLFLSSSIRSRSTLIPVVLLNRRKVENLRETEIRELSFGQQGFLKVLKRINWSFLCLLGMVLAGLVA